MKLKFFFGEIRVAFFKILPVLIFASIVIGGVSIILAYLAKDQIVSFLIGSLSGLFTSLIFYFNDFIRRNEENVEPLRELLTSFYNCYRIDKSVEILKNVFTDDNKEKLRNAAIKLSYKYNYNKIIEAFISLQKVLSGNSTDKDIQMALNKYDAEAAKIFT